MAGMAVAVLLSVFVLREMTQNRPDEVRRDAHTIVKFDVNTKRYDNGEATAAMALWGVCWSTIERNVSLVPSAAGEAWMIDIKPELGEHGVKRLTGCLEDVTLDRVKGHVISIENV